MYDYYLIFILIFVVKVKVSKIGDLSQGWPKGSLFNSYYTEV